MCIRDSTDTEGGKWLRWFFGLPYLPPDEVYEGFTDLLEATLIEAESFLEYFLETYIRDDAKFPPSIWAAAPSADPRTTNAVESFNAHYNGLFYYSTPHIHLAVEALQSIQVSTDLTLNSIRRGRTNPREGVNEERRKALQEAYTMYTRGEYTRLRYLKVVGYNCQPKKPKRKLKRQEEGAASNH